jgi:hypothetical protein
MPAAPAACPHCRTRLGLRTVFALADLWDARIRCLSSLRFEFNCFECGRTLRYPALTFASFVALAVLPVALMALARDYAPAGGAASIQTLLPPYWIALGAAYSFLAAPVLAGDRRRR